jgi:diguanylate cyclase (GGDEF)-like protein/PAS domain S-box-containing protein
MPSTVATTAQLFPQGEASASAWLLATPYVIALVIAAVLCAGLAVLGWRRRSNPGGIAFVMLMAGASIWALFYALEISDPTLDGKTLWAQFQYLGITTVPVSWFLFVRGYTGATKQNFGKTLALFMIVPAITVMLGATNSLHGLLWASLSLRASGGFIALAVAFGPWFWAHAAYSYILLITGTVVLVQQVFRYPDLYRKQAGLLVIAALAPWISNALFISGIRPAGYLDLTPIAFTVTGIAMTLGTYRFRFLSLFPALLPTARNQVIEKMKDGVLVVDIDNRVITINPAASSMLRLSQADAKGQCLTELLGDSATTLVAANGNDEARAEVTLGEDSARRYYDIVSSSLGLSNRVGLGRLLVLRDITERKQAEEVLRQSELRYRSLFDNANDLIFTIDVEGRFTSINEAVLRASGYRREELLALSAVDVLAQNALEKARTHMSSELLLNEQARLETDFIAKDGRKVTVEASLRPIFGEGALVGYQCIARDVGQQKLWEEALRHQALHDGITGLPNRIFFRERLQQTIDLCARKRSSCALLIFDLDRFKEINDTFGHHCGDGLLRQIAYRLDKKLRDVEMIARLGGDEFAVLLHVKEPAEASRAALRILDALLPTYDVEGQSLNLSASVGVAIYPDHSTSADALLRYADIAMYTAKHAGGSRYAAYSISSDPHTPDLLAIHGEFRAAFEHDEISLHYQPQIDVKSGRVVSVEALARWQHPTRGLIMPDQFIGLAEQDGLMKGFTSWAISSALGQCLAWRASGRTTRVSVNLSVRNLEDPEFPDTVARLVRACGADPAWLTLEITESGIVIDPVRTAETLAALRDLGVRISVDDFGAGHSSLGYLRRLPVDELKIDKSFVINMTVDKNDAAIVRSTITLAHDLGLIVCAEGVETAAAQNLLAAFGCDLVQGNHLGRPMPADAVASRLHRSQSRIGVRDDRCAAQA